jgi:segregation and condensation protein B
MNPVALPSAHDLSRTIEALAFADGGVVTPDQIADVAERAYRWSLTPLDIEAAIAQLEERLQGGGVVLHREAGGVRLLTHPDLELALRTFEAAPVERGLSSALLETAAIVAYRAPISKPEIDHVRGVDSGYALSRLVDLELVRDVGRSESVGRPVLYATTSLFLETFGLRSLDDLPEIREIEEILADPRFDRERAQLVLSQSAAPARDADADSSLAHG